MDPWICDGIPKNGQSYSITIENGHEPYENTGPDCLICGLPREAMETKQTAQKTVFTASKTEFAGSGNKNNGLIIAVAAMVVLGMIGGAVGWFLLGGQSDTADKENQDSPSSKGSFVSSNSTNRQLFSQGEQILLDRTPDKEAGASAFAQEDWQGAIAAYQQAANNNPNDPEGKIYLNNAKARQGGSPLTITVVVPITPSPNAAKEILRGVARYQEEFNQAGGTEQLEVVIANAADQLKGTSLSKDIIDATSILGVLGHGADPGSQQALRRYEDASLASLSPLTTSVSDESNPILKLISMDDKADELLGNYLAAAAKTLAIYAQKQGVSSGVIFYNSDSPYSQQLKQQLETAIAQAGLQVSSVVDVKDSGFDPDTAIKQGDVGFLALSKDQVSSAVGIAQANQQAGSPLLLLGGDELYSPEILVQGGTAIDGLILAVPWSFQPNDPFAKDAVQSWKGRVSWRTATAYDATQVLVETVSQHKDRDAIYQAFEQGVVLNTKTTDFGLLNEIPLVRAVQGKNGPPGSQYQFSALP
ncbi:MAG: ABC transporter substrate-binding protein [Microcystaceae cyanobacterium]